MIVERLGAPQGAVERLAPAIDRMVAQPILQPPAALVKPGGRFIHAVHIGGHARSNRIRAVDIDPSSNTNAIPVAVPRHCYIALSPGHHPCSLSCPDCCADVRKVRKVGKVLSVMPRPPFPTLLAFLTLGPRKKAAG